MHVPLARAPTKHLGSGFEERERERQREREREKERESELRYRLSHQVHAANFPPLDDSQFVSPE